MNTSDRYMATVRVDRKRVSTGCIRNHAVVQTEKTTAAGQKMSSIFKQVKSNLVRIEHTTQ